MHCQGLPAPCEEDVGAGTVQNKSAETLTKCLEKHFKREFIKMFYTDILEIWVSGSKIIFIYCCLRLALESPLKFLFLLMYATQKSLIHFSETFRPPSVF